MYLEMEEGRAIGCEAQLLPVDHGGCPSAVHLRFERIVIMAWDIANERPIGMCLGSAFRAEDGQLLLL
jgi:hypothetical protein